MISAIITSYKEPKTIGRAIEAIAEQKIKDIEIIVVAPDDETLIVAKGYVKKFPEVKTIKDLGNGKSAALNLAVSKAKGEILVLTDGDVYVGKKSVEKLTDGFKDSKVGAISGNVISLDSNKNMYGYWSHVLTGIANELRIETLNQNKPFICTGYFFAIRKKLFPKLPEQLLSEDGYISQMVYSKGYLIKYAQDAKVYVKFPTNIKDWIIQKKRSAGGYNQIKKLTGTTYRSFGSEAKGGYRVLKYITNIKEFFWIIWLFIIRIYLWIVIYIDVNLKNKKQKEIWKRVESTK